MKNFDMEKIREKCINFLLSAIINNYFKFYTNLDNGKIVISPKFGNILLYYSNNNLNTIIFIDNESKIIELKLLIEKKGEELPLLFLEQNTTNNTIFLILKYKEKEILKICDNELEKISKIKKLKKFFEIIRDIWIKIGFNKKICWRAYFFT